jgi:putative transposase
MNYGFGRVDSAPASFGNIRSRNVTHSGGAITWMQQIARNATGETWGFLDQRRYALHDRDTKFCPLFRAALAAGGIKPIQLPARSPNLNAYAERWVRSAKQECFPS